MALFLFSSQSAIIGLALAMCHMAGLLICAALAPRIHRAARLSGRYGLIDFLIHQHGITNRLAICAPFAAVVGLRTLVQLLALALALIVELAFDLPGGVAFLIVTMAVASYTGLGGHQAATETDAVQAIILLSGVAYLSTVLIGDGLSIPESAAPWYSLGRFGPELLIGFLVLFPFSTVLSVDNWHRITTSDQPNYAQRAYVMAALAYGFINLVIVWLGYLVSAPAGTSPATVMIGLRTIMPMGQGWIADAILIVAVMSSIDTFTMPLISAAMGKTRNLTFARLSTLGFFAALYLKGLVIGDMLQSKVAAFNSVVVFLPTVFGALILGDRAPKAALYSSGLSVASTLILTIFLSDAAGLVGSTISLCSMRCFAPSQCTLTGSGRKRYSHARHLRGCGICAGSKPGM